MSKKVSLKLVRTKESFKIGNVFIGRGMMGTYHETSNTPVNPTVRLFISGGIDLRINKKFLEPVTIK